MFLEKHGRLRRLGQRVNIYGTKDVIDGVAREEERRKTSGDL